MILEYELTGELPEFDNEFIDALALAYKPVTELQEVTA